MTTKIIINKYANLKQPVYTWTSYNEQGGSFSMGSFNSLTRALNSVKQSHPSAPIYLRTYKYYDSNGDLVPDTDTLI